MFFRCKKRSGNKDLQQFNACCFRYQICICESLTELEGCSFFKIVSCASLEKSLRTQVSEDCRCVVSFGLRVLCGKMHILISPSDSFLVLRSICLKLIILF